MLAGFAVAVVVLLLTERGPDEALLDRAAAAFIVSIFACAISSFVFAIVAAENRPTPRIYGLTAFASCGAAVGIFLMFWGLATAAHVYLPHESQIAQYTAAGIAAGFAVVAPFFLAFPLADTYSDFGPPPGSRSRLVPGGYPFRLYLGQVFAGSALCVGGAVLNLTTDAVGEWVRTDAFPYLVATTVLVSTLDIVGALIWSSRDPTTRLSVGWSVGLVVVHAVLLAVFVAGLPLV